MNGDMHLWRMSSSMMMAANLALSSSKRISFIAMTRPVPPIAGGALATLSSEETLDIELVDARGRLPRRPSPGLRIRGRECLTL